MVTSVFSKLMWVGRATIFMVALAVVLMSPNNAASAQTSTAAVPGTTNTVNTEEDELNSDGDCSLREAIQAANTNSAVDGCDAGSATERDAIYFALGKEATITLSSQLTITDGAGLTINGQKAEITVSGNDRVRVFEVGPAAELKLARLTVANGCNGDLGGGVFNNGGTLTVTNSTVSDNHCANPGGGIYNNSNSTLTVTNSTFSGNSANTGGAIYNNFNGTLTVTSSTFSDNSSNNPPGAISNFVGTATLRNTIVANSPSGGNCVGIVNAITDGGYNIDDDGTCGFSAANHSQPSTDPLLDPDGLADNGGPTMTIALLKGSPAINAIPKATNGCGTEITTDQRGVSRPQGKRCDIGAFEKKVRRR